MIILYVVPAHNFTYLLYMPFQKCTCKKGMVRYLPSLVLHYTSEVAIYWIVLEMSWPHFPIIHQEIEYVILSFWLSIISPLLRPFNWP